MFRLVILSLVQSIFLVAGQTFLKLTLDKIDNLSFTWRCIKQFLLNYNFLLSGIFMGLATFLWFYILKHFPFSAAYPLISFSYIIGTIASIIIFHEQVPPVRYIGIVLIIIGAILVAQK